MNRSKTWRCPAAAIALMLLAGVVTASAQEAAYGTSAAEIAERIAAAFPVVTGQVIGLEQERVLLDLGSKDKVIPGLELQVYREGQEFKHPYTGQVLGKLDRDVGRVRILEVHPNFSGAEIIQQTEGTMVQQGDHVRVTSARIILALPNVDVSDVSGTNTRSVTRDLTNALVKTGRFEVMNDQRIRAALQEEKIGNPDQLADPTVLHALWKQLRVSAVLLSKLSLMEKAVNWDVQVISTVRGDSVTLASSEVKGAALKPASSGGRGGGTFQGGEAPRIDQIALGAQEIPFKGQALAMGDFTGDGTMKLAISDGQGVYIYDLTKTGIKEIWSYAGSTSDNVIALDAADLDKSGVARLFVSNYTRNGLQSYVLEYREGKFVKILDNVPLHFRVLEGPDGTPQLYGQAAGQDLTVANPFGGPVRRYSWQGNRLVPGEVVPLPKPFNTIYGFALADLDGAGTPKVLVLDRQDYLRVFDRGGTEIYRTSDHYGGTEQALESWPEGGKGGTWTGLEPTLIMLQGRMYFADILGDGKKQLVVLRNTPSTGYTFKTRLYDKGKIFGLSWDGLGMQPVWETRELPGYIADFALVDPDGSGNRKLVLLVIQTNLLGMGKGRSSVIFLDIRPPG
ncbi:MAG: FlgT C-terminal domain-containing protein [Candidatus Methylomirabilales bacterium]